MFFCPLDGTLLKVDREEGPHGSTSNTFVCTTCPYAAPIRETQSVKTHPKRKEVDDILGGAAAWENVDRTMAICPSCNHPDAYFMQIQIRSAVRKRNVMACSLLVSVF
jgi:DNA-directed RNA polymerase III subunit RPC11